MFHEKNNKHDRNAVSVKVKATGKKLGHLSRTIAPKYAKLLNEDTKFEVTIASIDKEADESLKVYIKIKYDKGQVQSDVRQISNKRYGDLPRCAGVYSITNNSNHKTYIGSSSNINKRVKAHFSQLKHNIHPNKAMQSEHNREGAELFSSKVIQSFSNNVEQEHLEQLEEKIIKNHIRDGYALFNMTLDGKGQSPKRKTEQFSPNTVTDRYSNATNNIINDQLPERSQTHEDVYNTIIQKKIENAINFIYVYSPPISESFETARKKQTLFAKLFKRANELEEGAGAIAAKLMTQRQMEICLKIQDEIQFLNSHISTIEKIKSFSFIKLEKLKYDDIHSVFGSKPTNNLVDKGLNGRI